MIILRGYLASYTHEIDTAKGEHSVRIEVQKQLWFEQKTVKSTAKVEDPPISIKK